MSVAFNAKMTAGNGTGGTYAYQSPAAMSFSSSGMTVGAGATLLVVVLNLQGGSPAPTALACTWNGVSMNLACSVYNTGGANGAGAAIFTLVNPATGNNVLAASWATRNCFAYMSATSFLGTDTATGYNAPDNVTGSGTSGTDGSSVSVNTLPDDATLVCIESFQAGAITTNFSTIYSAYNLNDNAAASYHLGGSGANAHTFAITASSVSAWSGIHIIAAAEAGSGPTILNRRNVLYFI